MNAVPGVLGQPILLSDSELIESHMTPRISFGPPFVSSGYFLLNLSTNAETPLPGFVPPLDTWPH